MTTDTQLAPTDDEIHAVVQACRERGLREFDVFREVLAKWSTPQPVVREPPTASKEASMALSDKQISKMWSDAHNDTSDRMAYQVLAKAIEAEVRKQDDALIQQLVEALEGSIPIAMGKAEQRNTALIAGRSRLENTP